MSDQRATMIVRLEGGLGNQMFQYAFARAMSERTNAYLLFDTTAGFAQDRLYQRKFQLRELGLPIGDVRNDPRLRFSNRIVQSHMFRSLIFPATRKVLQRSASVNWAERLWPGHLLISERAHVFNQDLLSLAWRGTAWFQGYWQSPRYFEEISGELAKEVTPALPSQGQTQELGHVLRNGESVAVGIRLYEESPWPDRHARDGRLRTVIETRNALTQILDLAPRSKVFVFCTHLAPEIEACGWPRGTEFVTHEDGRFSPTETLWLLSQSRHHVITNSTFYWWGAWLSQWNYPTEVQTVLAADNFPNSDALLDSWRRF